MTKGLKQSGSPKHRPVGMKYRSKHAIENVYETMPKKYLKKCRNPGFNRHNITLPARILIVGSSGTGKTNLLYDFLKKCNRTFDKIILITPDSDEPIYNLMRDKMQGFDFTIYDGELTRKEGRKTVSTLPTLDEMTEGTDQTCLIFDDQMGLNQDLAIDAFKRARKLGEGGCTVIYLSQYYYSIPTILRGNANYLFLKGISSNKDMSRITSEYFNDVDIDNLLQIQKDIVARGINNFLSFDLKNHIIKDGYNKILYDI